MTWPIGAVGPYFTEEMMESKPALFCPHCGEIAKRELSPYPTGRVLRALENLLSHCDLAPSGETDFERAVNEGRLAVAEAMARP